MQRKEWQFHPPLPLRSLGGGKFPPPPPPRKSHNSPHGRVCVRGRECVCVDVCVWERRENISDLKCTSTVPWVLHMIPAYILVISHVLQILARMKSFHLDSPFYLTI